MSFEQKLNKWLQSGGSITLLWKWTLLGVAITYPVGLLIWEPICNLSALFVSIAIFGTIMGIVGMSVQGGADIQAKAIAKELKKNKENDDEHGN